MICMCSAIPHADFLRFFDDFGLEALHLIKAKLALVSTEVWVDGIYQRDFSFRFLRIKTFTIKTLDGTAACVQRVGYLCRFGVSWGVVSCIRYRPNGPQGAARTRPACPAAHEAFAPHSARPGVGRSLPSPAPLPVPAGAPETPRERPAIGLVVGSPIRPWDERLRRRLFEPDTKFPLGPFSPRK